MCTATYSLTSVSSMCVFQFVPFPLTLPPLLRSNKLTSDWLSNEKYHYWLLHWKSFNLKKYALLGRSTPKWAWIFKKLCMHTHTLLLKADPRQYFTFNNANKHLYCFVWWMAWFIRKFPISSISLALYQGTVKGAECGERKRRDSRQHMSCTCCPLWS